ncbi:serine hydrolase domain-containing protein [Paenibacillus tarimensis]
MAGDTMSTFYVPPNESEGGWREPVHRDDIAGLGLDIESLQGFAEWNMSIQDPGAEAPSSFLVIKNGWLVGEQYNRPETRFTPGWIASIGKSMSSCIVGRWMEAGAEGRMPFQVDLETPVYDSRYLPEGFPVSDPRKELITLSHILTHTSGLKPSPEVFRGSGFSFIDYTVGQSKAYPDSQRLIFDPGTSYGYSNVGYNHLAVMSPHLTGMLFHENIERELLSPIGIEKPKWYEGGAAYLWHGKTYEPSCSGPDLTARDLARFAYLLLRNGCYGDRQIVPSWYITEMKKVHRMNEDQPDDYGLGLYTNVNGALSSFLPKEAFVLTGAGLNIVLIVPGLELIVVRMSRVTSIHSKPFLQKFLDKSVTILR